MDNKFHKIIIADDELSILNLYPEILNWAKQGFSIVKLCSDGNQVIEYIKQNKVDVILTDINMPFCNGLDIAKFVYENNLDIKLIIVSGYNDFEYARSAMTYKVSNYLLKPIDIDELETVLKNTKDELDNKSKEKQMLNHFKDFINSNILDLCNKIFYYPADYRSNLEVLLKNVEFAGITINSKCYRIILDQTSIYDYINNIWKYDEDAFHIAAKQIMNTMSDSVYFVAIFDKKIPINIFAIESAQHNIEQFQEIVSNYTNDIDTIFYQNESTKGSIFDKAHCFFNISELIEDIIANPCKEQISLHDDYNFYIINKANDFIENNYQNDISLEDVADYVNLNKNYFCKLFKSQNGVGFKQKLISVRMQNAKRLIEDTDNKISIIAQMVGYNDVKLFSRQYQLTYNNTPAAYRNMLRKQEG